MVFVTLNEYEEIKKKIPNVRMTITSKEKKSKRKKRWIVPGWYEPPTYTRRHLSKPLKRMGVEQPIEFVNRRSL